ncbi:MAG: Accessory regulator [Herbinix sp.]|jgi:accessory gene regulator B|nr:Accessory regulator [Herbinix sp.]
MSYATLSQNLADRIVREDEEKAQYRDIYAYGLEVAISSLVNIIITVAIAMIFGIELKVIAYMAAFVPLRITCGGKHAKSHLQCTSLFMLMMLAAIYLAGVLPGVMSHPLLWVSIVSIALAIHLVRYHRLSVEERRRKRLLLPVIISVLLLAMIGFGLVAEILETACFGMLIQSVSMLELPELRRVARKKI